MIVYLIGYMYSGKTTLGKKLARMMGCPFYDTDQLIEEKYHTTIPLFFSRYGEQAFRKVEEEVLRSTTDKDPCVIATGGGTPCRQGNMDLMLQTGCVVWLSLTPEQVIERMRKSHKVRPVLAAQPQDEREAFVKAQLEERTRYYSQADLVFPAWGSDTDQLTKQLYGLTSGSPKTK